MKKQQLRNIYRDNRLQKSIESIREDSLQIANQLKPTFEKKHGVIHIFQAILKNKEIDTKLIFNELNHEGLTWVTSRSDFSNGTMRHFAFDEKTPMKTNKMGIPEPLGGQEISPKTMNIVFVPLLAVDQQGNRLGYGKGFYDRFLNQLPKRCWKIGLSNFPPVEEIPTEPHDAKLDMCVTPGQIYYFSKKAKLEFQR